MRSIRRTEARSAYRFSISAYYLIFVRAGDSEHSSYRTRMRYRSAISAYYLVVYESGRLRSIRRTEGVLLTASPSLLLIKAFIF